MLRGHVDLITPHVIAGWAMDDDNPDRSVDVSIFLDGRKLAQVTCDMSRRDLQGQTGFGDGRHGFRFELPSPVRPGSVCRITVRHVSSGAVLGAGDTVLNAPSNVSLRDLGAELPAEYQTLPAPESPRHTFDLLSLYDRELGLYNLLRQLDFSGRTSRQLYYAVYGEGIECPPPPAVWGPTHARDLLNDLLLSRDFQRNIMGLFLKAFPEKRRLLFVHIPKCAGSDLSNHLVRRYPSIPENLRAEQWNNTEQFFETLSDVVRRLHFSDTIFVRGHVNLADYIKQGIARPVDRLFTILREPIEIAISQVNYILTRLKTDAEMRSFKPDTLDWLRLLRLDLSPSDVTDAFLHDLGIHMLREQEIVRPNSMCHWLGGGAAPEVIDRLQRHAIELTNTRHYGDWLKHRWGILSRTRQNESVKFLTRGSLSDELLGYLGGISQEDAKLFEDIERRLEAASGSSVPFGG